MQTRSHLLYIDITQVCGIGCSFCMYADRHRIGTQFKLTAQAQSNLVRLINDPTVKRISISGEGEPLNNVNVFHAILRLSHGGVAFEFITSGFLPHDQLKRFYDETETIIQERGDTCNIRLSSDSYHVQKIRHRPHGTSLHRALTSPQNSLSFSFRSVDTDKTFTRNYLLAEAANCPDRAYIIDIGPLEDRLIIGNKMFSIDYKNHVNPTDDIPASRMNLHAYIQAIEARLEKRFTLGSLNSSPLHNGLDLTIKPNGTITFYGIENIAVGNIHTGNFSWEELALGVDNDPLLRRLHTIPLLDLLARVNDQSTVNTLIRKVNNPYWLVKELAKYPEIIGALASA